MKEVLRSENGKGQRHDKIECTGNVTLERVRVGVLDKLAFGGWLERHGNLKGKVALAVEERRKARVGVLKDNRVVTQGY